MNKKKLREIREVQNTIRVSISHISKSLEKLMDAQIQLNNIMVDEVVGDTTMRLDREVAEKMEMVDKEIENQIKSKPKKEMPAPPKPPKEEKKGGILSKITGKGKKKGKSSDKEEKEPKEEMTKEERDETIKKMAEELEELRKSK